MPGNFLNEPINVTPQLDIENLSIISNFNGNANKLRRLLFASESIRTHCYARVDPGNFLNIYC